MAKSQDPRRTNGIFVTGSHRSGTTWIGKTISYSTSVHYIGELFNPNSFFLEGLITDWFHYVTPEERPEFTESISRILNYDYVPNHRKPYFRWLPSRLLAYRITRKHLGLPRPLVKDPIAAMSAEWLARTFDWDVLCIVRHPASFVLSLKKSGWGYDYQSFLSQKTLVEDWLFPYEGLLNSPPQDVVQAGSVIWLCIYHVLSEYSRRNPGWQVLRYEDIVGDPQATFNKIYDHLGLSYTRRIANKAIENSSSANLVNAPLDNPHLIKRNSQELREQWRSELDPASVTRIRNIVEPLASQFYNEQDW
jgi:hypothetical protein